MASLSTSSFMSALADELILDRDPRTADWVLGGNRAFLASLFMVYVYVVKVAGPRFMKDRKPYDNIKPIVNIYNASMVILNAYFMTAFLLKTYMGGGYSLFCQGINYETRDEVTMSLLNLCWWYMLVRIADFMDTVFFVLRKKDSHVSFLHVAHHILVVYNGCYGVGYGPDGQVVLAIILNCFVHIIMYTYYFLSLLGPAVQKHLWWKRYLTQVQLVQFCIIFAHMLVPMFYNCGYPRPHVYVMLCEAAFFFTMFMRFYFKAYRDRSSPGRKTEESDRGKSKAL
ncbi:elongation of very long chain fatty acids protein AAEL008004 [Rhipicephalus sanguineus]|uniref:Elongation of very long chain fatty acids protein n=1 Tax=Rhipicephalus sanguineus TaxID=34632 RepID=A0A9D4SV01_RHISA|nr:elongation of very long chain fatty acids protein AAEL008004 [Rhipicephalus sanguineus]KAH7948182.1 hypothetical protein HPB52_019098 [Rhipicephalus sanguineus]